MEEKNISSATCDQNQLEDKIKDALRAWVKSKGDDNAGALLILSEKTNEDEEFTTLSTNLVTVGEKSFVAGSLLSARESSPIMAELLYLAEQLKLNMLLSKQSKETKD